MGQHFDIPAQALHGEANIEVISALSRLLTHEFRTAQGPKDLRRRLAAKGYMIKADHLATLPHGKIICPLSQLQG